MLTDFQIKGLAMIANACSNPDRVDLCKRALGKTPADADPAARAELERQLDAERAARESAHADPYLDDTIGGD